MKDTRDQNQTKMRHPKNDNKRGQGSFNKIKTAVHQGRQLAAEHISHSAMATKRG